MEEIDRDLMENQDDVRHARAYEDDYRVGCNIRDDITNHIWITYQNN